MEPAHTPHLVFNPKGKLIAFWTGADATTEHECGQDDLQLAMTGKTALHAKTVAAAMRRGEYEAPPILMDCKQILPQPARLVWEEREIDGELHAALAFQDSRPIDKPLDLRALQLFRGQEVAAAWDAGSFGIRVRGKKLVKALAEFHKSMVDGDALFAGLFLRSDGSHQVAGVCIAIASLLRPEHRSAMKQVQRTFEANVRLHLGSKVALIDAAMQKHDFRLGFVWPVWLNGVDSEVVYDVNPAYGLRLPSHGPYRAQALIDWIAAKGKGPLESVKRESPVTATP